VVLLVEDPTGHRVLHREPVAAGATLVLAYVHSSEHVPVRGTIRVEPDRTLRVVETAFGGFGPGLPELQPGDPWAIRQGMLVARIPGEAQPALRVRVLPLTQHRLLLPSGVELDLSRLMGDGGAVVLRLE
jgi:hypothetical protein